MLGGVAAGIARTYGIDLTLVRVLWVVAAFLWVGIPAYVVLWVALPYADSAGADEPSDRPRDVGLLLGLALVGSGALIVADRVFPGPMRGGRFAAPAVLIGGGVAILVLRRPHASDTVPESPVATAPSSPETPTEFVATEPSPTPTTGPVPEEPASAWPAPSRWPRRDDWQEMRRRRDRPRSFLAPLTFSMLLLAAGVASFLQATGALEINPTIAFALTTCAIGGVLVLSTWFGRARSLIVLGALLVAATAASSVIDVPLRGGFGDEHDHPRLIADVKPRYELAAGHLALDLRDLPLRDQTLNVEATVAIGRLEVDVPSTVRIEIDAHAGAGSLQLFGRGPGGWGVHDGRAVAGDGPGVLHLKLRVGAGEIDVHRFEPNGAETLLEGTPL